MKSTAFSKLIVFIGSLGFVFMLAACAEPGLSEADLAKTQAVVETLVAGTQTAKWEAEITKTPRPSWTPRESEDVEEESTPMPEQIATEIVHLMQPEFPGLPWAELVDTYSARSGAEGYASEGDYYENYQLLERPFGQAMNYLPHIDLRAAEIAKDTDYIYVTIFLDQSVNSFDAMYAVEIDQNADGRGDLLIFVENPTSTDWSVDGVAIYADLNGDVGGSSVSASDAPEGGDGFESLVFSKNLFSDPDLAFARVNPDRGGSVQLAFKPALFDTEPEFFWRVWSDLTLRNPTLYYYSDHYPFDEAGSPMLDSPNYPLGAVYGIDNTCRMPFQIANDGYEPGLCGSNFEPTPISNATLPSILKTPAAIGTAVINP